MPSTYPFPSVASLALSLFASARKVEKLPRVIEFEPYECVSLVWTAPVTSYEAI